MKNGKWLAAAGIAVLSVSALTACGGGSSKSGKSNTYSYVYSTDPDTLDYLVSGRSTTSEITQNGVDGLMEYDNMGNLVPSVAKDWTVSEDGLTYTYKIRKDSKWYTADGEEYASVTADDFVAGLKHAADKNSEALYLVQDSVKGLSDYIEGKTKDFSTVGVKAIDKNTVQYTLNQPESYWNSKLTYGILSPVNAEFLKSQGKDFGKSSDASSILYNGPFLISSLTSKSSIEFVKNENYWDKKDVHLDAVQLTYYDGQDQESLFRNFDKGSYTAARLFPTTPSYKKVKKDYGENIIYGPQKSNIYYATFNLNRTAYEHTKKTDDKQKEDTRKAILNKDFRQALTFGFNRTSYTAQTAGEEAANKALRNTLVPPAFVQIKGEDFGKAVEKELANYGDQWKDVNLADAQDGLYNPEKAKAQMDKAKKALEAEGVQFPIHIDMPQDQTASGLMQQAQSMKQSIEKSLGKENVVIDIIELNSDNYNNITYMAETTDQQDWDLSTASGWSPDYIDPSSYLDIFNTSMANAAQAKNIGLNPVKDSAIATKAGLDEFNKLDNEAAKITDDQDKRYETYAKAQAALADSAVYIPTYSLGGTPTVTKVVPFTTAFGWAGNKSDATYFKYMKLQEEPVKTKDYDKALKQWKKDKDESNKKYADSLKEHIKK
ncbi:peptide ABC transporter ATP-binding protein [Streptococcus bovimastitidis]|uniref:Peptide ABC transporter ATP-binding protein n=1 Tax=Streptococcus bovimastitidis TaxID=1856638 RepID=A0A1L8MK66_9STRE|nr:peptide ABC transporter substrate-binding protein [Streptococcus bovimastitidis]OJF71128.1 peptide ABC transporter ATP-binding protein [Streptococcus bovimastitidis]